MPRPDGARRRGKADPYDFSQFRGYRGPRFTPIPDEFLDHQLADLTSAEAKVMLFLFRKTYGYRKSGDRVSFAQLQHGTVSGNGQIIDRGTGLSKATIWRALKGLQRKGLIEVHRQKTRAGDPEVNYYHIREYPESPDGTPFGGSPNGGSSNDDPANPGAGSRSSGPADKEAPRPPRGSFHSDTTPVSKLNHRHSETETPGSLKAEPTREHCTRQDYTPSAELVELAQGFLRDIGYPKPSRTKRERALRIFSTLTTDDGYSLEELRAACDIAVSLGARGPELVPHVVGQEMDAVDEVGERLYQAQQAEQKRWQELGDRFDSLAESRREALLTRARKSNRILAKRPLNHPLVRAAAIALLDEG